MTMDTTDLKEKNFEADIERYLITKGGYIKGNQDTYDKDRAIEAGCNDFLTKPVSQNALEKVLDKYVK